MTLLVYYMLFLLVFLLIFFVENFLGKMNEMKNCVMSGVFILLTTKIHCICTRETCQKYFDRLVKMPHFVVKCLILYILVIFSFYILDKWLTFLLLQSNWLI